MPNLLRAALRPRLVRPTLFAVAGTALLGAALVLGSSLFRSEIVVAPPAVIVSPPRVTVVPAPVVMPPTPVVVQAPAPPSPEPPPPAPRPRALVPTLDAVCAMGTDGTAKPPCDWDDGFPAISADGTLIATKFDPFGTSDLPGLSIHFIDTKTSRVVRDSMIFTPEESELITKPEIVASANAQADDKQLHQRQRLLSTIYRRVADVQRTLDAKHFRTLHALGSAHTSMSGESTSQPGPEPVYAEIVDTTARIIDSATSQVLGRGDFWVTEPKRSRYANPDCSLWLPWSITLWWDPETRLALAAQWYWTGGSCMCHGASVETVRHMR